MATVTATLAPGAGFDNVTLTGWTGAAAFATTPVAGGQIEYPDTISVSNTGAVTGADGTYLMLYISPTGNSEAIQHLIGEPSGGSTTVTVALTGGAGYRTSTLASDFDPSLGAFQQWTAGTPAAGWQVEMLEATGYIDEQGDYWKPAGVPDGIRNVWLIQPNGTITVEQFDDTGLATFGVTEVPQGTWAIGTIAKTQTTASLTPSYSLGDATSFERTLNGTDWTAFAGTIALTGLTEGTNYPDAAVRAVNGVGSGTSASFAFTTEAAVVDDVPDSIASQTRTDVTLLSSVEFTAFQVTGVSAGTTIPISVTNGRYRVSAGGGSQYGGYTSSPSTVTLNDSIIVEQQSANTYSTLKETTINLNGVLGTFQATTTAEVIAPVASVLQMSLLGIPDGNYETVVLDAEALTVISWVYQQWDSGASTALLDVPAGRGVHYYVIGETKGGLQRGVTA